MNNDIINFNLDGKSKGDLIKVIGVGGGGSNAVKHMHRNGITDVSFAICNTDSQALEESSIPERVQLGASLTQGLGAGNKPTVGKQAALESIDQIERLLEETTRMVFITAGMGGGTGTGAAPIIAKICQERKMLTIGIVSLPFRSEGRKRQKQALEGIKELEQYVDSLVIINSERIRDIYGDLSMSKAFAKADDLLSMAAKSIAEIITVHGMINVDFADVESVMKNSGVANMGSARAAGKDRALRAVQNAINSPLLSHNNIAGATDVLINITSSMGDHEVTMNEAYIVQEYIQEKAGHTAEIIWGNTYDDNMGEELQVTIIVTGFERNILPNQAPIKEVISLDDAPREIIGDNNKDTASAESWTTRKAEQNTIEFNMESDDRELDAMYESSGQKLKLPADVEVADMTDEEYEAYMSIPAYRRSQMQKERQVSPDEQEPSRMSMKRSEDGKPTLRRGNSFLHDNVD
ncbi:MAG: cell division protein FtsZ [Mangrovibacterium sp.]